MWDTVMRRRLAVSAFLLLMAVQLEVGIFTINFDSSDVKLVRVDACMFAAQTPATCPHQVQQALSLVPIL